MIYDDEKMTRAFLARIQEASTGDCVLWTGSRIGPNAIPHVRHKQQNLMVRRWLVQRKMPLELRYDEYVYTTCGTALCVNEQHLFIRGYYLGDIREYIYRDGERVYIDWEN